MRPSARETNVAVYFLRCKQIGLSFDDLDNLDIGIVYDLMIESDNDGYKYPDKAVQADIDDFYK